MGQYALLTAFSLIFSLGGMIALRVFNQLNHRIHSLEHVVRANQQRIAPMERAFKFDPKLHEIPVGIPPPIPNHVGKPISY